MGYVMKDGMYNRAITRLKQGDFTAEQRWEMYQVLASEFDTETMTLADAKALQAAKRVGRVGTAGLAVEHVFGRIAEFAELIPELQHEARKKIAENRSILLSAVATHWKNIAIEEGVPDTGEYSINSMTVVVSEVQAGLDAIKRGDELECGEQLRKFFKKNPASQAISAIIQSLSYGSRPEKPVLNALYRVGKPFYTKYQTLQRKWALIRNEIESLIEQPDDQLTDDLRMIALEWTDKDSEKRRRQIRTAFEGELPSGDNSAI
jgi:hypothetical protein